MPLFLDVVMLRGFDHEPAFVPSVCGREGSALVCGDCSLADLALPRVWMLCRTAFPDLIMIWLPGRSRTLKPCIAMKVHAAVLRGGDIAGFDHELALVVCGCGREGSALVCGDRSGNPISRPCAPSCMDVMPDRFS